MAAQSDKFTAFAIDTNVAFGLVDSPENWQAIVRNTATLPNFRSDEAAAREHLLNTRLRPGSEPPSFGFDPGNIGQTLAEFFTEHNMGQ